MANNIKSKAIPIMLDKERELRFDLNALAELEDKYGDIEKILKDAELYKIKAIRAILWAGLIHEDENLTEKQVGALVSFRGVTELVGILGKALGEDMPEIDPKNPQTPA